mmetsp:Transcript_31083/g.70283  ORF Transcript_31083/g.70283 Transcript_31083/m.70283 type:complete len:200 (+) Transcript_31083:377-976(+)
MQLLVYFGIVAGLGRCLAWTVSPPDAVDCAPRAIKNAVAGALTAGAVAISPAFAAGDVLAGEQVFRNNCAACHAGGQNVIMPEKTLEKDSLEKYLTGGRKPESVVYQVTNGKNAMPAFGGRLQEDDINNVASYVIAKSDAGWETDSTVSTVVQTTGLVSSTDRGNRVGGDVLSGEQIFVNNCAACHRCVGFVTYGGETF